MVDDASYRRALLKKLRHVNELQRLPQLDPAQQAKLATLPQLLAELEGHGWLPEPEPAATSLVSTSAELVRWGGPRRLSARSFNLFPRPTALGACES